MNRRAFFQHSLAAAGALLVPTWRPTAAHVIDLKAFCCPDFHRYDLSNPFTQLTDERPYRYGTDAKICVRVPELDRLDESAIEKLPPARLLPWTHDDGGGWFDWPAKQHLTARHSTCPTCDGEGFVVRNGVAQECPRCDGEGDGTFPGIQPVGPAFIDSRYDSLIRSKIGACEFRNVVLPIYFPNAKPESRSMIQLRFAGRGEALLCVIEESEARRRMEKQG